MCVRIHAVPIGIPADSCYKLVDDHIKELGLVTVNAHDILEIIDGYIGLGYGRSSKQEMGKHRVKWSFKIGVSFKILDSLAVYAIAQASNHQQVTRLPNFKFL